MGDLKKSCPRCNAWTNEVGRAFKLGEPCPYCGLPAEDPINWCRAQIEAFSESVSVFTVKCSLAADHGGEHWGGFRWLED